MDGGFAFADGAPTGNDDLVQSGKIVLTKRFDGSVEGSISSSSAFRTFSTASSHFSLGTSTPPVLRALTLHRVVWLIDKIAYATYPARDPPIQAIREGEKAGALPALAAARLEVDGGGDGLFKIEI